LPRKVKREQSVRGRDIEIVRERRNSKENANKKEKERKGRKVTERVRY